MYVLTCVIKKQVFRLSVFFCVLLVSACVSDDNYAPIRSAQYPDKNDSTHTVESGETLYAIAWRYDMDYRTLATLNGLSSPYDLNIGQKLTLTGHADKKILIVKATPRPGFSSQKGIKRPFSLSKPKREQITYGPVTRWVWPTKGNVIAKFALDKHQKGINIGGIKGQSITAAARGKVVYSGNGISGYGRLIIIKHNDDVFTAYAHNRKVFVTEGQMVSANQQIADMGYTKNHFMLHFQIRKHGKPVDPIRYLPKKDS